MKVYLKRRSEEFIEIDRIRIEIDNENYEIMESEDKEIRIMKDSSFTRSLEIHPEVSNVIRIK
jgi:hypothetical protein